MKPLLPALLVLAAARFASAQIVLPAQGNFDGLLSRPELYDGLMIATALGPPIGHPLPGAGYLASQTFRVEDSRTFATGSKVEVFFPARESVDLTGPRLPTLGVPVDPKGSVPVGGRVLIAARLPKNGALLMADFANESPSENSPAMLGASYGPSALGQALYPTTALRLADDPSPRWRLLGSLAAAIPGTPDANAVRITKSISVLSERQYERAYGTPDDRFSRLFAGAVANDTAYHRALVDLALNQLAYWGYADRYARDLWAAAEDPNAFPEGLPFQLEFHEDPGSNFDLPRDFKHDAPHTWEQKLALLARAKSPTIAAAFLKDITTKPTDTEVRALAARFLGFADPRARWAMVERLAWWNGAAAPEKPVEHWDANDVRTVEYPGLDALVAAWRAKLGV